MLTTLTSYGKLPAHRQAELIRGVVKAKAEVANLETMASDIAEMKAQLASRPIR